MKLLARRKQPAYMECIHNRDHSVMWDEDDIVFVIDSPKVIQYANLNKLAKEFVVYSTKFEFQCPYVAYEDDWEIIRAI